MVCAWAGVSHGVTGLSHTLPPSVPTELVCATTPTINLDSTRFSTPEPLHFSMTH